MHSQNHFTRTYIAAHVGMVHTYWNGSTTNWKILKEMGIPDHLIGLLRSLYAGQEATVRTRNGTTGWLQIGIGVHQGCILFPCLFNLYAEYIMQNIHQYIQAG